MKMNPNGEYMSLEVARHIDTLLQQGATIILPHDAPVRAFNLDVNKDKQLQTLVSSFYHRENKEIFIAPWQQDDFRNAGIQRDVEIRNDKDLLQTNFAWTHRKNNNIDVYFISNQRPKKRSVNISIRTTGKIPEIWDAVTGLINKNVTWKFIVGRTDITLDFEPNQSLFIVLAKPAEEQTSNNKITYQSKKILDLSANWKVQFDTAFGGQDQPMKFDSLTSWTNNPDSSIKYYSGTAFYQQSFSLPSLDANQNNYNIQLEGVHYIVEVIINENSCGTA